MRHYLLLLQVHFSVELQLHLYWRLWSFAPARISINQICDKQGKFLPWSILSCIHCSTEKQRSGWQGIGPQWHIGAKKLLTERETIMTFGAPERRRDGQRGAAWLLQKLDWRLASELGRARISQIRLGSYCSDRFLVYFDNLAIIYQHILYYFVSKMCYH